MSLSTDLLNHKQYLEVVNKISNQHFISDGKWDWEHGLGHFLRVSDYVQIILEQLHADARTIELGRLCALLHDIGLSLGSKVNHAKESARMFSSFLEGMDLSISELSLMEHAILDHSKGLDMKSMLDISLCLADKLDVTYHRTENSTIQDVMNKEIQKIRKVDIFITKDSLKVNYHTLPHFDASILREWNKAYLIPLKVALLLEKSYSFLVNGSVTLLDEDIKRCLKNEIQ